MGGMLRVVQNEVDSILAAAPEQRQVQLELLRSAFIPWLATINPDNDQPVRRIARLADLPGSPSFDRRAWWRSVCSSGITAEGRP
jgi:hypothetical protein